MNKITSILTVFLLSSATIFAQGLAVNTTGARADTTAMLDVSSGTKGMLLPRMDSAHRAGIVAPAADLLVCQTNGLSPGVYIYHGGVWQKVGANVQPQVQVYTPGTYTFTTSAYITANTVFKVTLIGGGGGGGGGSINPSYGAGGGGGGAGLSLYWGKGLSPRTGYSVTVGAGGVAGIGVFSPANYGGPGGNSTVILGATTVVAYGGSPGQGGYYGNGYGGAGGISSTGGTLNAAGEAGANYSGLYSPYIGGNGASGTYGVGGNGAYSIFSPATAGQGNGSGGGGGNNNSALYTGGTGAPGICIIEWSE
jgi:hypothetical protein